MLGRISERTREADGSLPGGTLNIARNTSHLKEKGKVKRGTMYVPT